MASSTTTPPRNPDPLLNVAITPELVEQHGLTSEEYELILGILGREPNLTELGIFSVMWSEHCSYKNSRPLLKTFPTQKVDPQAPGQVLVKAGEENAGVIDIGDGWAICFKIESHNHPSAVEPFEGAATGVGGIIRDIFTMGARPVLLTNSLRFGELSSAQSQRIFRGVVHGISHYGNCIGIPNVGGDVYFDDCYEGNPLVNALCLGILRHDQIKRGAATGIGNPVYYVGPPTGRDGLGGASFASRELSEESAADRPAVQKGDPFMEKLLIEACLEMMAQEGLVVGIQDMGAAGLTCSTCETAARGGSGVEVELDDVPQRETGMNSYEIMLSESQERMLVIAQKGREHELEAIFKKWDLHAVQVGEVKPGKDMVVTQHGSPVVHLPAAELADEAPTYLREAKEPAHLAETCAWSAQSLPEADPTQLMATLGKLLGHPTIASKRWITQQYDHMVMTGTVVEPGSDAAVVRLRLEGAEKLIAIANDCNNRYCWLDPYAGGKIAIAECLRNLACSGARPLGMTNNLNFGNPNKPESYYMLKESIRGLAEACTFFDLPVVGGNVSLYNENVEKKIDPTPVVSIAGIIDDPAHVTTQFAKQAGNKLILLGGLPDELGGSYYLKVVHGLKTGAPPAIDLEKEKMLGDFLRAQIAGGMVKAAHDLSEGGLLCAVVEMCFAPETTFGAQLDLSALGDLKENAVRLAALFGESTARAVIEVAPGDVDAVLAAADAAGQHAAVLGEISEEPQLVATLWANCPGLAWHVPALRQSWETSIENVMAR
ncbi:MAG: phosphoribosylformylglycinamidine synthase subunit PurL [Verrucomicrobiota bacterium]